MDSLLLEIKKRNYFKNHPELSAISKLVFDSYEHLDSYSRHKGIKVPKDAYSFFQFRPTQNEISLKDAQDLSSHSNGHSHAHIDLHGKMKSIDTLGAYRNIIQNTVRDWNYSKKEDPSLQIKGPVFIKDSTGLFSLNPEILEKIPNFDNHIKGVYISAFGNNGYQNLQKAAESSVYKNPKQDPVIQRLESQITQETAKRIAAEESRSGKLSPEKIRDIESQTRSDVFGAFAQNHHARFEHYAKNSTPDTLPWIKDEWKKYTKRLEQEHKNTKSLYSSSTRLRSHIDKRVQEEFDKQVADRISLDRSQGISRTNGYWESKIDRQSIAEKIKSEEAINFHKHSQGAGGFIARRTTLGRELLDEYKTTMKQEMAEQASYEREYKKRLKEASRLSRIRDPKNDPELQLIRSNLPKEAEAEFLRQRKKLTDEIRAQYSKSIGLHHLPEEAKRKINIFELQRTKILEELKQKKYEGLFSRMSQKQINRYARKDDEFNQAYQRFKKQQELNALKNKHALYASKKHGLFSRAFRSIFRRKPQILPGEDIHPAEKSSIRKFLSKNSKSFDPLRNKYDDMLDLRDRINYKYNPYSIAKRKISNLKEKIDLGYKKLLDLRDRINYKYNPYSIAKRKISKRLESFFNRLQPRYDRLTKVKNELNEKYNPLYRLKKRLSAPLNRISSNISRYNKKYNPYEILKRKLAELRERLLSSIKSYAKNSLRLIGKSASKGIGRLAGKGVGLASKGTSSALSSLPKLFPKLGPLSSGGVGGSATSLGVQTAARGLLAAIGTNPIAIGIIIFFILLLFFFNQEEDLSEVAAGEITVSMQQDSDSKQNLKTNPSCVGNNCLTDTLGAKTSRAQDSSVLAETDTNQKNLIENLLENASSLGEAFESSLEKYITNLKEAQITYTITANYTGEAEDIEIEYPIPENAVFISATGKYSKDNISGKTILRWRASKNSSVSEQNNSSSSGSTNKNSYSTITVQVTLLPTVKDDTFDSGVATARVIGPKNTGKTTTGTGTGSSVSDPSLTCSMASPNEKGWELVNRWNNQIVSAISLAKKTEGVEVAGNVVKAIMMLESGGIELEPNMSGYRGLMQVGDSSSQGGGSNCDWNQPDYNINTTQGNLNCGVQHLARGLQTCNGQMASVIGQYFTGRCDYGSSGPDGFGTTPNQYVNKVLETYNYLNSISSSCK